MVNITFIDPEGERHDIEARVGDSLMQAAVNNMIPGILAECGGAMACATCHVYVAEDWYPKLPSAEPMEADIMSIVEEERPTSRLSCQIKVNESLEGLLVTVPGSSY